MLQEDANPEHTPNRSALSPRELQVLEMATEGMTNSEIATALGVSIHAIKFHLAGIYRKLHVVNRTEAAVTYLRTRGANEV